MTMAEARELLAIIKEAEVGLGAVEQKSMTTTLALGQLLLTLERSIRILNQLGLPEDATEAASKILRLTILINNLRVSLLALTLQSGPIGWVLAGIGALTTIMTAADVAWSF